MAKKKEINYKRRRELFLIGIFTLAIIIGVSITIILVNHYSPTRNNVRFEYDASGKYYTVEKMVKNTPNVNIPSKVNGKEVRTIGAEAFSGATYLKSINIPQSVIRIEERAFQECTNLESIALPDSIIYLGDYAFYNCASLESINISTSLSYIGVYAFYGTKFYTTSKNWTDDMLYLGSYLIKSTTKSDGIIEIKKGTKILSVSSLASLNITGIVVYPDLERILLNAFSGTSHLSAVYFKGSLKEYSSFNPSVDTTNAGNNMWLNAIKDETLYFYSEVDPNDSTHNYWHYVDGEVKVWSHE